MQANRFGPPPWASADLTFGQLRLLFVLGQAGPVPIGQLAEKLGVTPATVSELIDRMERRGMVARRHRADDRRIVECEIAEGGSSLLAQIAGARQQGTRRLLAVLTGDELADLDRLLQSIAERLAAATTDAQPLKETST
jgi:DNA-binding MarR family transcriptional regulator